MEVPDAARRGMLVVWVIVAIGLQLGLWTVGQRTALAPAWFRLLYFGNLALGALVLFAAWRGRDLPLPLRAAAAGVGLAVVAGSLLFVVILVYPRHRAVARHDFAAKVTGPVEAIRLVDFNVLHDYPHFGAREERSRALLAALRVLDPSIVVLQEASITTTGGDLAEELGRSLAMNVVYARANGSRRLIGFEEGSAILSRFPILDADRVVLSPRRRPWETRIGLVATLAVGPKERLTIVGAHLVDRDVPLARRHARDLLERLPVEGPCIVAGDFNAMSDDDAVKVFTARGFVDAVPGGIDHVLVPDGGWRIARAAWTLRPQDLPALIGRTEALSDHPGIVVDLAR